ncbi:serine proteinase stubble-like [Penaeus monodon]|uniref:serine proteinase stubble-like n=1 Tax=Penaeus monodon TaxID=6687 RepID=UPI0018A7B88D|nr:serine proteinase stubble-like [Penaeus monodon]
MKFATTCLVLLAITAVHGQNWSWGSDDPDPAPAAPAAPDAPADETSRTPRVTGPLQGTSESSSKALDTGDEELHPRFFNLCAIGIGLNCPPKPPKVPHGGQYQRPFQPSFTPSHGSHQPNHYRPPPSKPHYTAPPPTPAHYYTPTPTPHYTPTPVVQHIHTHTHIHHNPGASVGVGVGAPPQPPHHRPTQRPWYGEECQCVHPSFCATLDVVPRSNDPQQVDPSSLIDPRSRLPFSGILSNSTDAEGEEHRIVYPTTEEEENESRTKRALLEGSVNGTGIPERRSYLPGLSGCGLGLVCCRNPVFDPPVECGRRHSAGLLGRIKTPILENGDTEFGEYPWQAAILKDENGHSVYVCGATLIGARHVLTAAHCVSNLRAHDVRVRLGEWDVRAKTEFFSHIELRAVSALVHPQYYAGSLINDIAIITLERSVDFSSNPHISPVCLPDAHSTFVGHRCQSTGWGKDAFGNGGKYQTILKEVELPIISHHQCEAALQRTRLGPNFSLHIGNLCAGGEGGKDACKGDGGGPLVCDGPHGAVQLAGLVSWGVGCGEPGVPGVYVDVSYYLEWILEHTRHYL